MTACVRQAVLAVRWTGEMVQRFTISTPGLAGKLTEAAGNWSLHHASILADAPSWRPRGGSTAVVATSLLLFLVHLIATRIVAAKFLRKHAHGE